MTTQANETEEQKSTAPADDAAEEQDYLDVGPGGPRVWILALVALVVGAAVVAAFYGLYKINQNASPTPTPKPVALTQAAQGTPVAAHDTPTPYPAALAATPTATATSTAALTATVEPPTYTVQQGDTLIGIAVRLNVDVDALRSLNQVSGETIYPDQVLQVPPTVTPWPETGPFPHKVSQGETLIAIATRYQVTVDEIKSLNGLTSDSIFVGQQILIPAGGVRPPTPTPTPTPWAAAVVTGDLDAVYSLDIVKGHFTLHIAPDTRAADPEETAKIASWVEKGLDYSQQVVGRQLAGRFDVFVPNTLLEPPHVFRRVLGKPEENRLFLVYDASSTSTDYLYFITYGLIPLVAAQTWGEGASPLLVEGLAVYSAGQALAATAGQYLTLEQLCLAYARAGQMPRVSRELAFDGHLGHFDAYLAAGCFVDFLITTEGNAAVRPAHDVAVRPAHDVAVRPAHDVAFEQVYLSGDYRAAYERTLDQLEAEWVTSLRDAAADLPFDPEELVRIAAEIDAAYRQLWTEFEGTTDRFALYERLSRARIALLQGRLGVAREHLTAIEELLE